MLKKNEVKHPLWRATRRAGLRRIGWHTLRHTFASHLAMRGVALKVIQELMGHATIEMTMRYAHLSPEARESAVQELDRPSPQPPFKIAGLLGMEAAGIEPASRRKQNPKQDVPLPANALISRRFV